jgi:hypothetical protein
MEGFVRWWLFQAARTRDFSSRPPAAATATLCTSNDLCYVLPLGITAIRYAVKNVSGAVHPISRYGWSLGATCGSWRS